MLHTIKYMIIIAATAVLVFFGLRLVVGQTHAQDILETTFKPAKSFNYVVNIGNTRDSVGRAFLRDSYTIGGKSMNDPIIVRVIKWFLELLVILGVPLLIGGGIKYIVAAGDEGAQKKARSWMINVVIGIVLAMSSLAIVTFVSSLLNDSRLGGI